MEIVRWGVVGAGGIADRRTIPGMLKASNTRLVAVMEIQASLAEQLRAKHGAQRAYTNIVDLFADAELDAIYIASPVFHHKDQAIAALRAGKHILVEKPVALTTADGDEVKQVSDAGGMLAAAGFMMRYHSLHRKMKELVSSGRLGKVVSVRALFTCWYPEMVGAWRQNRSQSGGGALMDMGIHCVDIIQYVLGSRFESVSALAGSNYFSYEVEDSGALLLRTGDGAYCTVESYFNIPDSAARSRFEVYGTSGSMIAEGTLGQDEGGRLEVTLVGDKDIYDPKQTRTELGSQLYLPDTSDLYTKEIVSFSDSILGNKQVEVPLAEALQVQSIIEAAYLSVKEGKTIYIQGGTTT
jgi:predicted dehydrogenase